MALFALKVSLSCRRLFFQAALLPALCLAGCGPSPDATSQTRPADLPQREPTSLRLLVIDDPKLSDVISQEWRARSEGEFETRNITSSEFLAENQSKLNADAVIFPSCLLGELAQRKLIAPITKSALDGDEFAYLDIFSLVRLHEIKWGKSVFAVPLGSPQFVLTARPDILERYGRSTPTTWQEYGSLVSYLASQRSGDGDSSELASPVYPTAEPLAPGWAGRVLLARAASYVYHRSRYSTVFDFATLEPLIGRPPFVRALEELKADYERGPREALDFTPDDVMNLFAAGHCVMAISWPSGGRMDGGRPQSLTQPTDVQFVCLPGSTETYDFREDRWLPRASDEPLCVPLLGVAGRLGAVSRGARNLRGAANFLTWLAGPRHSSLIAARSPATTLFRQSQVGSPTSWIDREFSPGAAREYAQLVAQTQSQSAWLLAPRIPGQHRYMQVLDQAVRQALTGEASARDALSAAAGQWRSITNDLEPDRQRSAYFNSLGLE